jgi:hypothetical protein
VPQKPNQNALCVSPSNGLPGRNYVTPPVQPAASKKRPPVFSTREIRRTGLASSSKTFDAVLRNVERIRRIFRNWPAINYPVSMFAAGSTKHTTSSTQKAEAHLILMRETTDRRTLAELCE